MSDDMSNLEGIETANQAAVDNVNADHFKGEPAPNIVPNEATVVSNPWNYSENIPGVGEKPEWFLEDKYSNVSQQAEACLNAQKKLGEFAGAPKDGYSLDKYKDVIEVESPFIHKLLESSKTLNMSQAGLNEILELFTEYEKSNIPNQEEFIKSLDPHETDMAKNLFNWAKNNFTEEETEVFSKWITDKHSLNILSKMRGMSRENRIPSNSASGATHLPTLEDLQSLVTNNYKKYSTDSAYRDRIERQRNEIMQREGKM